MLHNLKGGITLKIIQNKSKKMLSVEKKFNNNIEEILRSLYVDEGRSVNYIADKIGITYSTTFT